MIMWRPHLKNNCHVTMQGTYLANPFLAPLLINEANAAGNALYLQGDMECHQTQRSICNEMQMQMQMQMQMRATFQSDIATLHAIRIQRNESVEAIRLMESCLALDMNAQRMEEACCGLKGFGTSNCQLLFLSPEYVKGILILVGICVRICDSNINYRFMMVFPQSSEEDITSVSIVGWIVNRRIDCCIRIVGLSGMLFWDWGD
jgi:hypothetical protein